MVAEATDWIGLLDELSWLVMAFVLAFGAVFQVRLSNLPAGYRSHFLETYHPIIIIC